MQIINLVRGSQVYIQEWENKTGRGRRPIILAGTALKEVTIMDFQSQYCRGALRAHVKHKMPIYYTHRALSYQLL